jgi:hypothetical protein
VPVGAHLTFGRNKTLRPGITFVDYVREIGVAGQLSFVVFLATLGLSALIYIRRLDLNFRLSLVPLSLTPMILGILGSSIGAI